eukprot:403350143
MHASQSPSNSSPSKALYSFPKAQRFPNAKKPNCMEAFYNEVNAKNRRSASIGLGKRGQCLILPAYGPSPQLYHIQSQFDSPNNKEFQSSSIAQHSRGYSFGTSRQYLKNFLRENPPADLNIPGPGKYFQNQSMQMTSTSIMSENGGAGVSFPKYTMRAKTPKDSSFQNFTKDVPGPGGSATGGVISKSGRTMDQNNYLKNGWMNNPGPGNYDNKLELNQVGNYQFYKWKSSGATRFSKANRLVNLDTSATRKITPGPGAYRQGTDFGFYTSDDQFYNNLQAFAQTRNLNATTMSRRNNQSYDMSSIGKNSIRLDSRNTVTTALGSNRSKYIQQTPLQKFLHQEQIISQTMPQSQLKISKLQEQQQL